MGRFSIDLEGDFSLAAAGEFLSGFKPAAGGAAAGAQSLSLGFLLDRTFAPVAVHLEQRERRITGEASGPAAQVAAQVERMLSLDVDARSWPALGRKDPVVGALQQRYAGFRAVCFPSPYEAALWGILAQRVSMTQASAMKEKLARAHGSVLTAGGAEVIVPPPPAAWERGRTRVYSIERVDPAAAPGACVRRNIPVNNSAVCRASALVRLNTLILAF